MAELSGEVSQLIHFKDQRSAFAIEKRDCLSSNFLRKIKKKTKNKTYFFDWTLKEFAGKF